MNKEYTARDIKYVAEEPGDRALQLIATEIRQAVTNMSLGIRAAEVIHPECEDDLVRVKEQLSILSEFIVNKLMLSVLVPRLVDKNQVRIE